MLGAHDDHLEREAHAVAGGLERGLAAPSGRRIERTARSSGGGLGPVPPQIDAAIDGARGSGHALPGALARAVGERVGDEFSDVRVHSDARADTLSRRLNAVAFTTGRDIFFRSGSYDPTSAAGRQVLTHELTHVTQQRGAGPRAPIQRFVFQIGQDDAYTRAMFTNLITEEAEGEDSLKISALWDTNDADELIAPEPYNPQVSEWKMGFPPKRIKRTEAKLGALGKTEPLRIVAHGSITGRVAGYTATALGDMLIRIGLPGTHTGGIDVHACLPASAWTDDQQQAQPPVIVALQDHLAEQGFSEVVRGYVHCIFPSFDAEVPSVAYSLMQKVALEVKARYNTGQNNTYELSDDQIAIMRNTMGTEAANRVLKGATDDGKTVNWPMTFFFTVRDWLQAHDLMSEAKLRRADSVRAAD